MPIDFKMRQLNYQMLKRKSAFRAGLPINAKPEYNYKDEVMNFHGIPDILPVERVTDYTLDIIEGKRVKAL